MSKLRYMLLDLTVFALLFCALEAASAYALAMFSGEVYTLSLVLFISLLMMMRWGAYGVLYAVLGGAVYSALHGGTAVNYAVYMLGSAAVAVNLLWFRLVGRRKVRESPALTVMYCITGYLAMETGRALVSVPYADFVPSLTRFLSVDSLSALLTVVFILIARKQNGVFENQNDYLMRLSEEKEERRHGN